MSSREVTPRGPGYVAAESSEVIRFTTPASAGSRGRCASNDATGALLATARSAYQAERRREVVLGPAFFSYPSWDILLDLFIAKLEGRRVSASSACIAASAPASTALRQLNRLIKAGLVDRNEHPLDARSWHVSLTQAGEAKVLTVLSEDAAREQRSMR